MGDPMAFDAAGPGNRAAPTQDRITVRAFMLDRHEVTVARFRRFVTVMGRSAGAGFSARASGAGLEWVDGANTLVDKASNAPRRQDRGPSARPMPRITSVWSTLAVLRAVSLE